MQAARGASLSDGNARPGGRRTVGVLLGVAALVLVLDQVTKAVAERRLGDGRVEQVVDGVLQLRLVHNPGAAFSLGTNATVLLTLISVAVSVVILRLSRRLTSMWWAVALGGMLGGALGNLTDRIFRPPGPLRGHVVDFLELPRWPVFNLADSAIVGAAVLIVVLSFAGVPYDRPATTDSGTAPPRTTAESDEP